MAKRADSTFASSHHTGLLGKTDLEGDELPSGWVVKRSKTKGGRLYYYNTATKTSTWEKPQSTSATHFTQDKSTNEGGKVQLKDKNNPSSDMNRSGLSMISMHYAKKKDITSSGFSQKRKAEDTVVLESIPTKCVKSKNTSTVHKSSIQEHTKQNKIPNSTSSLFRKENVKRSSGIEADLQENIVKKKEVSTADGSVKEARKPFTMTIKEIAAKRNIAVARRRTTQINYTPVNNISQTVPPTSNTVTKTTEGINPFSSHKKNKVNKNNNITTTPVSVIVKNKKNLDSGSRVEGEVSEKYIDNGPINSMHNATILQSPSAFDAKSVKQDSKNEPLSYESLLNQPSDYGSNLIYNKESCSKRNDHSSSSFNASLTPNFRPFQVARPHCLTNPYARNKNWSSPLKDNNIVKRGSENNNKCAVGDTPNRRPDQDKWCHNSPLTNRLEASIRNSPSEFLDSKVDNTDHNNWSHNRLEASIRNSPSEFLDSKVDNIDHNNWSHNSLLSNRLEDSIRNSPCEFVDSKVDNVFTGQPSPGGADVEQDTEDMEVDEEEILSNLQDVRTQTSSVPSEPRGILTEIVTKAKSSNPSTNPKYDTHKSQIMLVIDTNVLISSLEFLKKLLTFSIPEYGEIILVMPWIVMQELDSLKVRKSCINNLSNSTSQRAAKAINFIHSHLVDEDPQLIGQTPAEANEATGLDIECNDDRILQCCLQFQRKCNASQVVLLTRDTNLANKALIMGIKAASNQTLWSQLKIPDPTWSTGRMINEDRRSTTGTPDGIKSLNGTTEIPSNPELHKPVTKCTKWNRVQKTNVATVLQDSSTPFRSPLLKNANPVVAQVTVDHKRLPQTEAEKAVIMNKFQAVWNMIHDIKSQIANVVADGKSHVNYNEAVHMLQVIIPLLSKLKNDFSRCLSLSPIILWEHEAEFNSLCNHLNTFFMQAHISCTDSSQPVEVLQLIKYFSESGNRPNLLAGLEHLSGIVEEVDRIFQMCSLQH